MLQTACECAGKCRESLELSARRASKIMTNSPMKLRNKSLKFRIRVLMFNAHSPSRGNGQPTLGFSFHPNVSNHPTLVLDPFKGCQ